MVIRQTLILEACSRWVLEPYTAHSRGICKRQGSGALKVDVENLLLKLFIFLSRYCSSRNSKRILRIFVLIFLEPKILFSEITLATHTHSLPRGTEGVKRAVSRYRLKLKSCWITWEMMALTRNAMHLRRNLTSSINNLSISWLIGLNHSRN